MHQEKILEDGTESKEVLEYAKARIKEAEQPRYLEVSKEKERRELLKSKISILKDILSKNIFENNTLVNDYGPLSKPNKT